MSQRPHTGTPIAGGRCGRCVSQSVAGLEVPYLFRGEDAQSPAVLADGHAHLGQQGLPGEGSEHTEGQGQAESVNIFYELKCVYKHATAVIRSINHIHLYSHKKNHCFCLFKWLPQSASLRVYPLVVCRATFVTAGQHSVNELSSGVLKTTRGTHEGGFIHGLPRGAEGARRTRVTRAPVGAPPPPTGLSEGHSRRESEIQRYT